MERVAFIAAASLLFAGCAAQTEGAEQRDHVGRSIQPIVGGTASGSDQDAVVILARFEDGARVGLCTATLVAANLVVTARHCVSASDATAACGSDGQPVTGALLHGDRAPASLAVFATAGGAAPDTTADVGASAHGKSLVVDDATTICNHDLAYVILDKTLTAAPIAPIRLGPLAPGDALTAVGFGITEMGALPMSRMQRNGIALVGAGPMAYPDDARYGVGDAEFLVGESACSGDSGSPAFAKSGAVIGVASRAGNGQARDPNNAASTCLGATAHAVYAELGANVALATRAFKEAGAKPWLEGEPDPRIEQKTLPPGSSGGTGSSGANDAKGAPRPTAPPAPPGATTLPPIGERDSAAESGGCSASGKPVRGAVEDALGIVLAALLVLRLRSRARKRSTEERNENGRLPYVDVSMRESFASMSDEHR